MKRSFCIVFLYILFTISCVAQTFRASAPSSVGVNEPFRVEYTINTSDASGFSYSMPSDLELLGGPSTSSYSSTQIINGKRSSSSSITYTLIIQATKKGTLKLPVASVHSGGRVLKSSALTIKVAGSSSGNSSSSSYSTPRSAKEEQEEYRSAQKISEKDVYVRAIASRTDVSEQEPIVLTYKVYARQGVGLSNITPRSKPEMKGFWTQEVKLPQNLQPSYDKIGGQMYRVYTFAQYVIFPQQTGNLIINALPTTCCVLQRDASIDPLEAFFNGGGSISSEIIRTAPSITIHVAELPKPKPANFCGGVGQLHAKGELVSGQPRTNDIVTYRITISGQGNTKLIQAPKLTFPKSFDVYAPKTIDNTKISFDGIQGGMQFDYTFVPREVGKYEVPAIDIAYFNTVSRKYETIHLKAVPLDVEKGTRSADDVERQLALRNADVRGMQKERSLLDATSFMGWMHMGYWLTLAFIIFLFVFVYKLTGKARGLSQSYHRNKHQNRQLREAEIALENGNSRACCTALNQVIQNKLSDANVSQEKVELLHQLKQECEMAAYSPENDMETPRRLLENLRKLLVLPLLFFVLSVSMFAQENIDYTQYADSMQKELNVQPTDVTYYNLGNCKYRLKEMSQAVLAYQRALHLNPGNDDARFNLAIVQTKLQDQFTEPDQMFFVKAVSKLCASHSSAVWCMWAILAFALLLLSILVFIKADMSEIFRKSTLFVAVLLFVAFVVLNVFAARQAYSYNHNNLAVVMASEVPVYSSAVVKKKAARMLHEGTTVEITDTYGKDMLEVSLPDGASYWITASDVERVVK